MELIILPRLLSEDMFSMLNYKPCKGFILEGPPGTGKTLIVRKLAELLRA